MNWIIIILVLALAVGPVMYLLPNAKDRRLTALREQARKLGLMVQITSVPRLDPASRERVTAGGKALQPRLSCAAYKVPVGRSLIGVEPVLLLKIPSEPTVAVDEVLPGWDLREGKGRFWRDYTSAGEGLKLAQRLSVLPEDALGFAIDDRFVACFWQERATVESNAVGEILGVLEAVREDLCARFATSDS